MNLNALVLTPTLADTQISVLEEVRQNRDALIKEAAEISTVQDRLDADDCTQILKRLSEFSKDIESQRSAAKAPVLELGRKIDALGKELVASVDSEKTRLSRLVGAFEAEERRKADEERRRLQDEQLRIQREAEKQAMEAARQAKTEEQRDRAVDQVVAKAQEKIVQVQQQIVQAQVKKAEGSKLLTKICFEVTDIRELHKAEPNLVTLEPNGTAIRAILKQNPNLILPGLKHWTEQTLSV
jgi:hypothetical protein